MLSGLQENWMDRGAERFKIRDLCCNPLEEQMARILMADPGRDLSEDCSCQRLVKA